MAESATMLLDQNTNFDDLFIKNIIPSWWDSDSKVTYRFCQILFEKCEVYKYTLECSEQALIEKVLGCLDDSILFYWGSDNFKNFKRKVISKKKDLGEVISSLYTDVKKTIGENCEAIGLSISAFGNIVSGQYDNETLKMKGAITISNALALELYRYFKKHSKYKADDLCCVMCFLSGKENNCSHKLYKKLVSLNETLTIKGKTPSLRDTVCKMLLENFEFPKSVNELYTCEVQVAKKEFEKAINNHKKELRNCKLQLEKISQDNETLRELLFDEKILNSESNLKYENLSKKLDESSMQYNDACVALQTLISNSNCFSEKEIERREEKRNNDIKKLKLEKKQENEKYIKLLENHNEMKSDVIQKNNEIQTLNQKLLNEIASKRKLQKLKSYYRNRIEKLLKNKEPFDHNSQIQELKNEILCLENEKVEMEQELESFMENELPSLKNVDGSYKNRVRACFQDLVLSGVGIKETKTVIVSVLKNLVNIHLDETTLPSETFARSQFGEARLLAMAQLGSTLVTDFQTSHNTLQTDGTSKHRNHLGTFDVRQKSGENFVIGLRPMVTGDSETIMSTLKDILMEIEKVCSGSQTMVANKILASIKNTMSDRHIVQKKFNTMLQDYRSEVLPTVIEGWENLADSEKNRMKSLNFLFCGLHYVVGLADQAEAALKTFDKLVHDETPIGSLAYGGYSKNGESGTLRLIRTLCKAVQDHGCEKSGRMDEFNLSLEHNGISTRLAQFKGNRFNILFYNAGIVYFLHRNCREFFLHVFEENRLLKAVHYDLNVSSFIAGCRALGLIDKFLTGPLWRLLVEVNNVLELNQYYQRIYKLCLELSESATEFLKGKVIFFPEFENGLMNKDHVFDRLMEESEEYDKLTEQLLELLFGSFAIITKRMLHDHLEGGKFDQPSVDLMEECESAPNENVFTESNFGCLDRLLREKPNANEITIESIIMCKSNRMKEWRDHLSDVDKKNLMDWAKKNRIHHYNQFIERRKVIRKLRNERRLTKIENKKRKNVQMRKTKEELCTQIEKIGGLWKNIQDIEFHLSKLKDEGEKTVALRCQLKFREKVLLEGNIVDTKLFRFSLQREKFSNSKLKDNLEKIISNIDKLKVVLEENTVDNDLAVLIKDVPIEKLNREKDRLRSLLVIESEKANKKDEISEPKAKKKKNVSVVSKIDIISKKMPDGLPDVTNSSDVIGKRVCHLSTDEQGKPKWFNGTVICIKPGLSQSEMVIRYDGYTTLYSFEYSELDEGLLKLIPLDPEYIVGKFIMHKFTDENEADEWFEDGKIISYDPRTELYTVNYFHSDGELASDDEQYLDVYETMSFDLVDDYIKHDIRFV